MNSAVIIVGAGGHAGVLAEALQASGVQVLGFTDADPRWHGRTRLNWPVLGGDDVLARHDPQAVYLVNGIGGVRADGLRWRVQEGLEAQGWRFAGVRHPSAVVSPSARLADDVQVLAGAIVQSAARLGKGTIVNTAAVVEHDVVLGEFVHVAPRAVVCGEVLVGRGAHLGAGCVVRQGLSIGAAVTVGAGSVVVRDALPEALLVGVPARALN